MEEMTQVSYMYIKLTSSILIAIALILTLLMCQVCGAESSMSSFLSIDADARGSGMGGAQGATVEGLYSAYWNPAGLSNTVLKEISTTYYRTPQDINYSFIGFVTPSDIYGAIGFYVFYLGSGPIESTFENLDGSFAGKGEPFSVHDVAFGLTQSKKIVGELAYGVSVKFITHRIKDKSAYALSTDFGVTYQPPAEGLCLGFVIRNISTAYKFLNSKFREPLNIKVATSYRPAGITMVVAADYNIFSELRDSINVGVEYWIADILSLRTGSRFVVSTGLSPSISFGLGLNLLDLYRLDYSVNPDFSLGISQRFSLTVKF